MCLAFFLIVPSVIVVTIFLVHSIAQRIGFKVRYFSLILCAIMSLAVNFAAIEMSTYLDKWHYVRLGALLFVASLIVTLVNRYLIKHDKSDIKIITDDAEFEEELALEEEIIEEATAKTDEATTNETVKTIKHTTKALKTPISQIEIKSSETTTIKTSLTKPLITTSKIKSSETNIKKTFIPKVTSSDTTVAKIISPDKKITTKNEEDNKSKITIKKSVDVKKVEKPIELKLTDKNIAVKKTEDVNKIQQKTTLKNIQKPAKSDKVEDKTQDTKSTKPTVVDKMADINAHLGSLDDILDYAYAQKSKGNLNQAVLAYQKALDRYRNDDYAPFIAIDLGNIYKEQAAYTKFIKTYEEALKLPVVIRNADTHKEFNKTLTYMRIVQSVLIRHRALTIPFSKIPRQYLQEIETEFKSLQFNRR